MRTEPIDPVELRTWLLAQAEGWRNGGLMFHPDSIERKVQMAAANALEAVRHTFLQDMSAIDTQ